MLVETRDHPSVSGVQKIHRFENGYGASVVRGQYTFGGEEGKWELGVIKFRGPGNLQFNLCYDTPVTDDVIGHLTDAEVDALLSEIQALPAEEVNHEHKGA